MKQGRGDVLTLIKELIIGSAELSGGLRDVPTG